MKGLPIRSCVVIFLIIFIIDIEHVLMMIMISTINTNELAIEKSPSVKEIL
jgi:hypothetical protein